jgi:phage baseplate assembly protein V
MNTAEILRLLSNLLRIGYVDEIDYDARKVRVTSGENTTDWISWKVDRAGTTQTWDPPTLGEQVLLASPEGELNNAIVLMSLYSDGQDAPSSDPHKHVRLYPDGARIEYDFGSGELMATGINTALLQVNQLTTVDCPLTVFKGKVVVEDLFTYQAGMSGTNSKGNKTSIEGDFIQKNGVLSSNDVVLDTHDHGGVVRGGSNTDGPNK